MSEKKEKPIECPLCKRSVKPETFIKTNIPTVVKGRKCGKIPAIYAGCCDSFYLEDKLIDQQLREIVSVKETVEDENGLKN